RPAHAQGKAGTDFGGRDHSLVARFPSSEDWPCTIAAVLCPAHEASEDVSFQCITARTSLHPCILPRRRIFAPPRKRTRPKMDSAGRAGRAAGAAGTLAGWIARWGGPRSA